MQRTIIGIGILQSDFEEKPQLIPNIHIREIPWKLQRDQNDDKPDGMQDFRLGDPG